MNDIDELQGRELDAEVARLMGWERFRDPDKSPELWNGRLLLEKYRRRVGDAWEFAVRLPRFSEDIAAAFQVVEKLQQDGIHANLLSDWNGNWAVEFWDKDERLPCSFLWSQTAPLAICRAALRAVQAKGE